MQSLAHKNSNKLLWTVAISIFVFLSFLQFPGITVAEYKPLQDLPVEQPDAEEGNFTQYMVGMVNLLIGVAAVLAIIFITIGGLQYITTDSISNKESGKETIQNALFGLLLALASWLLLYTINPDLVQTFEMFGSVTDGDIGYAEDSENVYTTYWYCNTNNNSCMSVEAPENITPTECTQYGGCQDSYNQCVYSSSCESINPIEPETPTGLTCDQNQNKHTLTWQESSEAMGYQIFYCDSAIMCEPNNQLASTENTYYENETEKTTNYKVRAVNNAGESEFSELVSCESQQAEEHTLDTLEITILKKKDKGSPQYPQISQKKISINTVYRYQIKTFDMFGSVT
ncbi:MAG: fibronectin type III domain-containing protein [Patescibacteria group bacterium]